MLKLNINNKCTKIYFRILKNMKLYNKQFLSIIRYTDVIKRRNIKENSLFFYVMLPDILIHDSVNIDIFKDVYVKYIVKTYKIYTPYIVKHIKYNTQQLSNLDENKIINKINNNIIAAVENYNKPNVKYQYIMAILNTLRNINTYFNNKNPNYIEEMLNNIEI